MNNRTLRLLLLPILLLSLSFLLTRSAHAQSKTFYWESYDVDVRLNQDGTLDVIERQTLVFSGGTFSFGYATIPYNRLDAINNISVTEGDVVYSRSSSERPNTFTVEDTGSEIVIYWHFAPTEGRHTYTFSYNVEGAVRVAEDGNELTWLAIPDEMAGRVNSSRVTISVPDGVTIGATLAEISGSESDRVQISVSDDGRRATFVSEVPFFPGDTFGVGVRFPAGQLPLSAPQWQAREDRANAANLVLLLLAFIVLIGLPLGVLAVWYTRGRDPDVGVVADMLPEPPDNLPPAFVGSLLDERVDLRDIVSTLVDLAQRGYLEIREEKSDHEYVRTTKSTSDLTAYERQIVTAFFGANDSRRLSDLRYKFASKLPGLQKAIYDAMIEADMFRRSPETVRTSYRGIGAALGIGGVVGIFFLTGIFPDVAGAVCLGLAVIPGALALLYTATHMPRKTERGADVAARWRAFERYLKNIEKYTDLAEAKSTFDRYLPYAVAFGMERSWIRKFSEVPDMPAPPWYQPFPDRPYPRRPYRPVIIGGGGGGAPQMPTLEGMSDSLSGSLVSMSDGLTRMLNSTNTVLRSQPPSSSSSSRSGGGGFSGGFSGGGFSGGGSRGFG